MVLNPDPGHFFKIYYTLTNQNFKTVFLFFVYFFANAIQKSGIFYNLAFFNCPDSGFESINFFFAVFG